MIYRATALHLSCLIAAITATSNHTTLAFLFLSLSLSLAILPLQRIKIEIQTNVSSVIHTDRGREGDLSIIDYRNGGVVFRKIFFIIIEVVENVKIVI